MVIPTRSFGPSAGPDLLWHQAQLNLGEEPSSWPIEVAAIFDAMRRHHAPAGASERGSSSQFSSASPPQVGTIDILSAAQEQLKCYTRRKHRPPGASAAGLPEENCEANCEESSEFVPSPKLRGLRSSRKRREILSSPLVSFLAGTPVAEDDGDTGDAPEPEASVGRPRRERKRKVDKAYMRSDSAYCDWVCSYPNEPVPSDYRLGEVETISGCEEGFSDGSDAAERPMSLRLQTDIQRTRKARRILVEESRTEAPPPAPPPAPQQQQQHDESAMCPQTPEKLQENNGECEGDRHPSALIESAPDKDSCCTPSGDSSRGAGEPDSFTERRRLHLVIDITAGSSHLEELISVEAKVKVRKKHSRPKVKRPPKVKVAKPPKVPKTFKRKSESSQTGNAKPRAEGAAGRKHDSLHTTAAAEVTPHPSGEAQGRERQNESAPSSKPAEPAEAPHISAEAIDCAFGSAGARNTGEIRIDLPILESSSGEGNQSEDGRSVETSPECDPRSEAPGGSLDMTMENPIPEPDVQQQRIRSVVQCLPSFRGDDPGQGGAWMEEQELLSTPRGNASMVLPLFPNSPSFSDQPHFESGDSLTDSDGERTGPIQRTRRARRSLLPAVEAAEHPLPPFFRMTEAEQRQYAWALSNDPRFCENPMGLVEELIRDTPEHLLSELRTKTNKLVFDVIENEVGAVEPAVEPSNHESSAREELQLVVYGRKAGGMVVYQEVRAKAKYKPKVVLDPMTINTFDRLMLQGGEVKDADRGDQDWVGARKLWSERAHHFNYIMRQVQGDRTFSKWGGSLLDSVVGAFLTQNVSDFLSSNAFMELRAHFPVREELRSGSGVSSEEQSSVIASGSPVPGTSSDTDLSTSQPAEDQSKENVADAGVEESVPPMADAGVEESVSPMADAGVEESVPPMADAEAHDDEVVIEASITHAHMDKTFVEDSHDPLHIFVESLSSPQRDPDQSDPYSFSDEELSVTSDLVIALEAVHIGSTPAAQGSCSPMDMASPSAGAPDEHITESADNVETSPATESVSEVTAEAANTGGDSVKEHNSGTQAETKDVGEKGDTAGGPAPSRFFSMLEAKFQRSVEDDGLTPDEREKMLAATLRAVLGKRTTEREAAKDQMVPLDFMRWKIPRNRRPVDMTRFRTKIKLLTGAERGNYELKVGYKLNSEEKVSWEAVRADVLSNKECERDPFTAHSIDWEAVRHADVAEVADVIKERGMHYVLGGRIKSLLERIHHDQDGLLDLEWIRKLSPTNAQNFLTSVRGLGLKSVECIRLLTLHHPSFPVDTNVGRIVVRLGWVPLEPLPEKTQLHLLEMYPVQEQIQKYMWPRLCTLDQQTLYEFHYQLITFGKVFCTKSKPNCNACPMQSQCKHYESAYCSAKPLLQGPGEASNDSMQQMEPLMSRLSMQPPLERRRLLILGDQVARASSQEPCIPIIEVPNSPDRVQDIEDAPFTETCTNMENGYVKLSDADLEPSPYRSDSLSLFDKPVVYVDLNETSTQESEESRIHVPMTEDAVQDTEGCFEDVVEEAIPQSPLGEEFACLPSQELVLLPPDAASFPAPQLKNVQRLRTIHYVYELPDHHPLLVKMDKRDPEDPCFYLLAIWNSDEVPEAMPKISDDDASNPFACSQPGEAAVRGTLLVPCRTAMKGSFPLNGTYFQVNEVFADHASSIAPIDVPRTLLWDLRRRFVYFGTSVTSIFKDMSQEEIQCCFKKGYICVRAFDQRTRRPRLLAARLHQSGAKIVAGRTLAKRGRRATKALMTRGFGL